ncbi:MAG: VanZ family protein [Hahellaceae bacterium]|nr:VanZ family protein [Hahellaceae bacterium]MCP5169768.1 VanZ family protein [Hahellaceae bacterium]
MNFITKLQFWVLLSLATWLSLTPQPGEVFEHFWDKGLHLFCWMTLFLSAQLGYGKLSAPRHDWRWMTGLFVYASQVEILQYFVPGRFVSFADAVANSLGLAAGLLLWRLWRMTSARWSAAQTLNRWLWVN